MARLARVAHGLFGKIGYNPKIRAHRKRAASHGVAMYLGKEMLDDVFLVYLPKVSGFDGIFTQIWAKN